MARWLERLQELDFQIVHRRGRKHTNADALSRLPCRQCGRETHGITPIAATTLMSTEPNLRESQLADSTVGPVLQRKESDQKPSADETKSMARASRRLFQMWDQLLVRDGVLYRQYIRPLDQEFVLQLVVPGDMQSDVIKDLHEGALGGHLGEEKTLARLKERFYWPGHYKDVHEWCRTCPACAARKAPTPKGKAPLQSIKAGYPMQMVATDIVGPFPESQAGNSYILVVADYFTRWTEAYAIPNQEATTVAKKLTDEFFFRFSPPEQLHSDQGRQFESEVIAEMCKLLGVAKTRTTPYHPQSDGLVERFNRTLLSMLATAARERLFEWEDHLRRLCMAYNSSVHPTTGYTPFYLMFGRLVRMPVDIMYGTPTPQPTLHSEYATQLRQKLEAAYQQVCDRLGHKLGRQKELYDRRVHGKPFEAGELVWLHSPAVPRGQSKKLYCPWTGPFRIVRKISDATYRIQNVKARHHRLVVHFDSLKLCPQDMRLPDLTQRRKQIQATEPVPPPGTTLELVDDLDSIPPRYPQRHRAPPVYYQPVVTH